MRLLKALVGVVLAGCAAQVLAQSAELLAKPHESYEGGVVGFRDVIYQVLPGFHPQTMDIYVPSGAGPFPAVVFAHGGSWSRGSPRMGDTVPMLTGLAARGFVVVGINYRFHGETKLPGQVQDVKAAIRWLRSNAELYGVDRARVGLWGASAGSYLTALAGTSCGVQALAPPAPVVNQAVGMPSMITVKVDVTQSDCVQAVVDWYGPIDFAATIRQSPANSTKYAALIDSESALLGCRVSQCSKRLLAQINPITYIDASDPPFLIMHGDNDQSVPSAQSSEFYQALTTKGVKATLVMVPGVDHRFVGATPEKLQEIWNTTYDFFDQTLAKH